MKNHLSFLVAIVLLQCWSWCCEAVACQYSKQNDVAYTITVDKSGHANFSSVQSAIDAVPEMNTHWLRIKISPHKYTEKVTISVKKPCIILEGAGKDLTSIEWGDHDETSTSATFTSSSDNIAVRGITFKNTYNTNLRGKKIVWTQAVSARISGDKYIFHDCAFLGLQDTLWDEEGSHYYKQCYIEGAIDFIFGNAQSIYEDCEISVNIGKYVSGIRGSVTAQKKEWADDESGFVLKNCVISGTGTAYLGRAWGPYSTVIVYNSTLSDVILPEGWNAWNYVGHESNFTYVECSNQGKGSDMSKRVPWAKKDSVGQIAKFLSTSFIDKDGWLAKIPNSFNS